MDHFRSCDSSREHLSRPRVRHESLPPQHHKLLHSQFGCHRFSNSHHRDATETDGVSLAVTHLREAWTLRGYPVFSSDSCLHKSSDTGGNINRKVSFWFVVCNFFQLNVEMKRHVSLNAQHSKFTALILLVVNFDSNKTTHSFTATVICLFHKNEEIKILLDFI